MVIAVTARYAIYYAPDPAGGFWQRAAMWLGRDAASGASVAQPHFAELDAPTLHHLTADPRHYGFHATLKAPFALADNISPAALVAALHDVAAALSPFDTPLAPQALGRFVAFRPLACCPRLQQLHETALLAFEGFRAPMSDDDIARRRTSGLSAGQDGLLLRWGYPYVLSHFRFHMTLTSGIGDAALRARLLDLASGFFRNDIGPHRFDSISLFRQPARDAPFALIARAPFGTPANAG